MKINNILILVFLYLIFSCKSAIKKIETINSKANLSETIVSERLIKNSFNPFNKERFIDSVKNKLLVDKTVVVDYSKKDLVERIGFNNTSDTILLADINVISPTGGIPLNYYYDVKENDQILFELKNNSRNKLNSFEIKEGDYSRYVKQNLGKKDIIKSSFTVTGDNTLNVEIKNDNLLKNLGLFKSNLYLKLKKLSDVSLKSEIIFDTIFTKKKIIETRYDTIFNIETNLKFKIGSKLNLNESNEKILPIIIKSKDSLISWAYWVGLNSKDSITIDNNKNNPVSLFSVNEINNIKTNIDDAKQLFSTNNDLSILSENYTLDRRSMNFSDNYSVYIVDNYYRNDMKKKGSIKIINNSKLYDFDIQFVVVSISLVPSKFEVEKEVGEIKKYIKLTLVGS